MRSLNPKLTRAALMVPMVAALMLLSLVRPAPGQSFEALARRTDAALGRILAHVPGGTGKGSGFVLSKSQDGRGWYYLTNNHVVAGATLIEVGFLVDGRLYAYRGSIAARSAELDLAVVLLAVDAENADHRPQQLPVGLHEVRKGQAVAAFGFPGTADTLGAGLRDPSFFETTLTTGTVSKLMTGVWDRGGRALQIVQHTAAINPGNSGGPLLDHCGQVRGLNTAGATFVNDDGVAANDTYWASSSLEIARFLDANGIPYRRGSKECLDGDGLPSVAMVAAVLILAAMAGGAGLHYSRRHRAAVAPLRPRASAGATVGGGVLELRVAGGVARALTADELRRGVVIGRGAEAQVRLDDASISRRHAELRIDGRRLLVTDLGSTNGSTVDGRRLTAKQPVQINSQSQLSFGTVRVALNRPGDG